MAPNRYEFDPDEREKRLGKLKFGADWQFGDDWTPDRIDSFLNLLKLRFRPPVEYLAVGECPKAWPIEALEYGGSEDQRVGALAEHRCGVLGKKQLAYVRELLRLYDKYGPEPKGAEDFERLDPGDDLEKLREARRLMAGNSQADVKPSVPTPEPTLAAAPDVEIDRRIDTPTLKPVSPKRPKRAPVKASTAIRGKLSPRKRGPKTTKTEDVTAAMIADVKAGHLTMDELHGMSEKDLVAKYSPIVVGREKNVSRWTCREARNFALATLQQTPTNSDK